MPVSIARAFAQWDREHRVPRKPAAPKLDANGNPIPKKIARSKDEIFLSALSKIRSLGNEKMDEICKTILTEMHNGKTIISGEGDRFTVTLNRATPVVATVESITTGKSIRKIMTVGDLKITGAFAARAYGMARASTKPVSSPKKAFDNEQVAALASLLS